jgi:LAS superfamily LD-carboxypeptidase LdcB
VASDQAMGNYYNRRDTELEAQTDAMIKADPNLQFIPRNKLQEYTEGFPGADALMYQDPTTVEGEARVREEQFEKDNTSIFPQNKYGGRVEMELDDAEIDEYRKGGYIVEELDDYAGGGEVIINNVTYVKYGNNWVNKSTGEQVKDEGLIYKLYNAKPIEVATGNPIKPIPLGSKPITQKIKELSNSPLVVNQEEAQRLSEIKKEQDLYNPQVNPDDVKISKDKSNFRGLEDDLNKALGFPMDKAVIAADAGNQDSFAGDQVDNFRHPNAGRYTAEGIANYTGNIPYLSNALGFIGANALGVGHEVSGFLNSYSKDLDDRPLMDRLQESGEDIYNNYVGSKVGASDMTPQQKTNYLLYLSNTNQLPDGIVGSRKPKKGFSNNLYFKKDENDKGQYKSSYAEGGSIVEDISMPLLTRMDDGAQVKGSQGLNSDFSVNLTAFINAAKADGIDLGIASGFRSVERQKQLWEQALKKYGSPEKARKWVAPPGKSSHNKGIAVDLNSSGVFLGKNKNTKATQWAHANAEKYGLHFRMGWEPWHIEPLNLSKEQKAKIDAEHQHSDNEDPSTHVDPNNAEALSKEGIDMTKYYQNLEKEQQITDIDNDYGNWSPQQEVVVDPRVEQLNAYSKLMSPSIQNVNDMYAATKINQQQQQKQFAMGGYIDTELTDKEITNYKNGGYIVEYLD